MINDSNNEVLQIKLRSFDPSASDHSVLEIIEQLYKFGLHFIGPIAVPKKNLNFSYNKFGNGRKESFDFFNNKARHDRFFLIFNADNASIIEIFQKTKLSSGVGIEFKTYYSI